MDEHAERWIVVLEVDHDRSVPGAGREILQDMVALLAAYKATARYDDHRYSVQLDVPATALPEAASLAVARWAEAVAAVGLPSDGLVRAEVLTPSELELAQALGPVAVDRQPPASIRSAAALSVQDAAMEDALLRRAFCDPLTGLAGHGLLTAHVERALAEGRAGRGTAALMLVDLDVAAYGRRHGPAAVDDLVGALGAWLPTAVRGSDTTARVGPHTLGVLVDGGSVALAVHLAESVLDGSAVLLDVAGGESAVSVGVAVAAEPGYAAERLFAEAEAALATARRNGGGCYKVFIEATNDDPTAADGASTLPATAGSPAGPPDRELYLPLLGRVATVAGECDSLEDAVATVLHQVRAVIRWPVGCLWARPPGANVVVASDVWSVVSPRYQPFRDATGGVTVGMGDGAVGEALARRRVVCVPDLSVFSDAHAAAALDAGLVALVAVPVVVEYEVVAVLELLSDRVLEHDHERLAVLATVGTQLGRAAERGRPGRRSVARAQDIVGVAAAVTEGVVACDADGSIRVWNWGAERTFGYSRDEALGRPLELVLPDLLVVDPAAAPKAWDRGRVVNPGMVVTATRRDGSRIPVWAAVVSREPSGSRPTTVVVSALSQRAPGNWPG